MSFWRWTSTTRAPGIADSTALMALATASANSTASRSNSPVWMPPEVPKVASSQPASQRASWATSVITSAPSIVRVKLNCVMNHLRPQTGADEDSFARAGGSGWRANLVEMLDAEGGWKAADTTLWREHLHAATIVGRAASARVAAELGYAIAPDHGPSGRLGHWRIVGVPDEVLEIHSKRAAEITEAIEARGESSYRARNIAARDTRAVKRHTPVGELMPRWHDELAEVGWTVPELVASVERAGREAALEPPLSEREILRLMAEALAPEG